MLLSAGMDMSEEGDARDENNLVKEVNRTVSRPDRFGQIAIRYHPKSRTGCITCKTRRIKCDEAKPNCERCKKAGFECDGYAPPVVTGKAKIISQRHHAKSRSGCLTCKARRVKCDEVKPVCGRCAKAELGCGYRPIESGTFPIHEAQTSLLQQHHSETRSLLNSPLNQLPGSQQDKRSFRFFCSKTAPMLAGHFDAGFWTKVLVQITCSEPAVWHSVLSLSALHECYGGRNDPRSDYVQAMRRFALQHYSQAVGRLTGRVSGSNEPTDTILIGCLIFIMIEMLLQNSHGSLLHLHSGTQIIRDWRANSISGSPTRSRLIETYLAPIFDHIGRHVYVFGESSPLNTEYADGRLTSWPENCNNLFDARASLLSLRSAAQNFERAWRTSKYDWKSPEGALALEQKKVLISRSYHWSQMFDSFLARPDMADLRDVEVFSINLIRLQHKILSVCIFNSMSTDETSFDEYVDEFEEGLNLAEQAYGKIFVGRDPRCTSFFLQMQNISPIYIIGTKCRNPEIRRRALNLLKHSHEMKGFWDAGFAYKLVERVIEIEEEGLEDLLDPTGVVVPSDWSRIYEIIVNPEPGRPIEDEQRTSVTFRQRSRDGDSEWILKQEYIVV